MKQIEDVDFMKDQTIFFDIIFIIVSERRNIFHHNDQNNKAL